ncbi:hypothetical protein HELRODRAFT_162894 [Helobdella robusta]|uniref:Uncharacterized protein n=1 Tax=Helobdella robusta TaxID=6412 RepID=T1ETC0_HELRO|nr:hypothetical protein HELRODRAFT_162894 [Helobdella robusta]ESN99361.1 hypothetical protein HELRODRAFT_162894 [Helobdella robusta]
MPRSCKNRADKIFGKLTLKRCRRRLTPHVKKLYELYFGCKFSDQDKNWVPHGCCVKCASSVSSWLNRTGGGPTFGVPMVWREPQNYCTDCYFCSVNISGHNSKVYPRRAIVYPNLSSAICPVPHLAKLPVPLSEIPNTYSSDLDEDTDDKSYELSEDANREPHFITGSDLNDLVQYLYLTKQQNEVLVSRLQQWHLLAGDVRVSSFRKRFRELQQYFSMLL